MTTKILILVLSYNVEPYASLMKAQQETFDSIEVEGVRTVYYYGGGKGWVNEKEFSADASDSYYYMTHKCTEALKEILKDYTPDIIWRTNSSSYTHKQRLKNFAETLPTEKLYAGWEIQTNEGFSIISGAGIFFTPDIADILIKEVDPNFCKEEDYYIGSILHKHGIPVIDDKSRVDIGEVVEAYPPKVYHYKLKNGNRLQDAANFYKLHEKVK